MKKLCVLSLLSLCLSSCSSYISYLHDKFDRYDRRQEKNRSQEGLDTFYGQRKKRAKTSHHLNTTEMISTHNTPRFDPRVKRDYRPLDSGRKRYKAKDLNDTDNSGGLWVNQWDQGKVNYLFSQENRKRNGDIVLIHIYPSLKNDITQELRRAFPSAPKKKSGNQTASAEAETPGDTPTPVSSDGTIEGRGVQDKISSIVIDEINRDHLLLKGRKNLLYKNRKRTVELQALVARRSIDDNDIVKSNDILDFSVRVVKR